MSQLDIFNNIVSLRVRLFDPITREETLLNIQREFPPNERQYYTSHQSVATYLDTTLWELLFNTRQYTKMDLYCAVRYLEVLADLCDQLSMGTLTAEQAQETIAKGLL